MSDTNRSNQRRGSRIQLRTVQSVIALAVSLQFGFLSAARPSIGTVVAPGAFRLDQSLVTGNATLFEGSVLETNTVASSVDLGSRASFLLGAGSRGILYGNRLVLEKGSTRLDRSGDFYYEAAGLRIHPKAGARGEGNIGQIRMDGTRRVYVAALTGSFRVLNHQGKLVANMAPGAAFFFEPQTPVGAGAEAGGANGGTAAGGTATGGTASGGAAGGTAAGGAAAGAGATAGVATTTGIAVTTITVVAGVAVAATVGGLAAAGSLPGQGSSETTPPVSR